MMRLPLDVVTVPTCVEPYRMQPMIIGWSTFTGLMLIAAVTFLVWKWMDGR